MTIQEAHTRQGSHYEEQASCYPHLSYLNVVARDCQPHILSTGLADTALPSVIFPSIFPSVTRRE
jgi:hypothetical protein